MKESSFRETMSSLESNIPVSTDLSELVNRTAVENHCYIQITNQDGTLNYQSPVIAMNQSQLYETNSTTSSGTAVQVSVQFSQDDVLFLNRVLLISLPPHWFDPDWHPGTHSVSAGALPARMILPACGKPAKTCWP